MYLIILVNVNIMCIRVNVQRDPKVMYIKINIPKNSIVVEQVHRLLLDSNIDIINNNKPRRQFNVYLSRNTRNSALLIA